MFEPLSASATCDRWVNGGQTMKFTSAGAVARCATMPFANSAPSAGSVFIFQLPATIFFLIFGLFL